jgi:hypothetical protein
MAGNINLPRPQLGRPSDKRVTAEFLRSHNLSGPAFDPAQDVDLLDAIEEKLEELQALVAYADPALVTELRATAGARQDALDAADEAYQTTAANYESARQFLALVDITSVLNLAATPAGTGLFRYRAGAEAGQVHERVTVGGPLVRRLDLEIGDAAQVQAAQASADAAAAQASALVPDVTKVVRATTAVLTPEQFGATGQFDPSQFGTAGWADYAAANNASLAFQQAFAQAKNNPGVSYTLRLAGRYYLGPLSGTLQRQHGRTIYGTASNLTLLGTYAQAEYERMPVVAEGIPNLTIEGAGCELYQGADIASVDTGIGILNSRVDFTGTGTFYGFSPAAPDRNTEQHALIRYLAGGSGHVGAGWTLTAMLGDGLLIGGLRTDQGGTNTAHASGHVTVDAQIIERWGDGSRPWYKAGTQILAQPGDTHGTRSRLCAAIIHAHDITVSSQHLSGGVDTEANVDGQLMVNVAIKNARFRDRWILPFSPGNPRLHPWQPEREVLPGTAGAVLLDNNLIYTSPASNPIVAGGGIFGVQMDTGWVYMHNKMIAPIDGLTFDKGLLIFGNQGVDTNKTTTGGSVKNVSARTVLRRDLYGLTPNPFADSNALVVLSGNVRDSLFENITVNDATADAVAVSHVPNNTAGNTEAGNRYINCANTGRGAGTARVLGFTPDGTSLERGSASVGRGTTKLHTVLPQRELRLSAGKIDYAANPAGEYLIFNETRPDFLGFVDASLIPEGTVFVFRGTGPEGVAIAATGTVSHRNNPLAVVLAPSESMTMQMRGGILYEVSRSIAPSPVALIPTPATATAEATATRLNELLTVLKARGVT